MPESVADCGLLAALSLTVSAAESAPTLVGAKVIVMAHVALAASVVPHVVFLAKLAAPPPVSEIDAMLSVAVPGLLKVTVCAVEVDPTDVLGKVRLAGVRTACGAGVGVAVPDSIADCGLLAALSVTVSAAESAPILVGEKVIVTEHVALAASVVPHVELFTKLLGLLPVSEMDMFSRVAVPGLLKVTVWAGEIAPTAVL